MDEIFSSLEKLDREELLEVEEKVKELLENFDERQKETGEKMIRKIEKHYFKQRWEILTKWGKSARIYFDGMHDMYKVLDGYNEISALRRAYNNVKEWFEIDCINNFLREKYKCVECKESDDKIFRSFLFPEKSFCGKCKNETRCHLEYKVNFEDFTCFV